MKMKNTMSSLDERFQERNYSITDRMKTYNSILSDLVQIIPADGVKKLVCVPPPFEETLLRQSFSSSTQNTQHVVSRLHITARGTDTAH